MTIPRPRKHLTEQQTEILQILYKFRFATIELIVQYQELDSSKYTHTRLKILLEKKYIGRNYDGHDKIHGNPATYFLLANGIRALKEDPDINTKALNGMYKEGAVKEQFINRCLSIFRLHNALIKLHGDSLSFHTKNELTGSILFPKPRPDAFITLKTKQDTKEIMLELIEASTPFSTTRARILRYLLHIQSEQWDGEYPVLVLCCETEP
jgi:hypothetical protein